MIVANPIATETVATLTLAFTKTPLPPSPFSTPIPNHSTKEVPDRNPQMVLLAGVLAMLSIALMTIRDWRKLGD